MNGKPHALEVLLACLDRLRTRNQAWAAFAEAHHADMVAGRFANMAASVDAMERELVSIADEEDMRIRSTLELAFELDLPDDPPPRLSDLADRLPSDWADELRAIGQKLREAVAKAEEAGKRSSELALIGLRVSQGAIRLAQEAATRSIRPPAAYARSGQRTNGTAVPVFQRAWKA